MIEMFKLFKKKSRLDLLNEKYQKLMKEAYDLSTVNRKMSDRKQAEAEDVLREIESLKS